MGRCGKVSTMCAVLAMALVGIGLAEAGAAVRIQPIPRARIRRPPLLRPGLVFRPTAPFLSNWAEEPPVLDGAAGAAEWEGAASMNLPHGVLRMQNDLQHLYLLLDVTADTGDDPIQDTSPWGDYFWLVWDVNGDGNVTAGVDLLHGVYPGTTTLGVSRFVRPGALTGIGPSASRMAMGFGPSSASATPHRFWEIAIRLVEIGAHPSHWLDDPLDAHPLRLGLHIVSQSPAISDYLPTNVLTDFSRFYRILLALSPDLTGVGGPVFATVGIIPSTEIQDGYATVDPSYMREVKDSPFGSTLNIFSHFDTLRSAGAKHYQVLARKAGAADYTPLRLTWSNYRWEVDKFVLRQIAPDDQDRYTIPPAAEIWSLRDILVRWPTSELADGLWELKVALFDAAKNPLPEPEHNYLALMLDNTPPFAQIHQVTHAGVRLEECAIVHLGPEPDGLNFTFTATDHSGHLGGYSLVAHYGSNRTDPRGPIAADSYAAHVSPTRIWAGVTSLTRPAPPAMWRAPTPCAYQFRLVAYNRTTDGYTPHIHWAEWDEHFTVLMEGPALFPLPPAVEVVPVTPPAVPLLPGAPPEMKFRPLTPRPSLL